MSSQPLRYAWRSLRRTPVFTITAIVTLVIGIAATVAIFTVVNGVLLRPLPYSSADRLVGVWHDMPAVNIHKANQSPGTYFTYKKLARSIESIGLYDEGAVNVSDAGGEGEPQRLGAAFITQTLIPTLGVTPLLGRNFTEAEDLPKGPDVVIISEGLWRSRFGGDPKIVGRMLDVGGKSREIVGVMPSRFRFPSATVQLWLPLGLDPVGPNNTGFSFNAVARLKRGVTTEAANRDLASALTHLMEVSPEFAPGISSQMVLDQAKPRPFVTPMLEDMTESVAKTLWMIAVAAGLVLLVACANVCNLILVRADARQRELAVREALGAGRARVLAHFLGESAVMTSIAGAIAIGLAWMSVRLLVIKGPVDTPRISELRLDGTSVVFAIAVSAFVALVCSIVPALRIGRVHLSNALREGGRGGTAGKAQHRVRGALVAAQIALALVVLAGSGLLLRTFQQLNHVRPGFDPERVMTFWMSTPGARYKSDTAVVRFYQQLTDRVAALPGVQNVGLTSRVPLVTRGLNQNPFYVEGDSTYATKIPPLQMFTTVDGNYFQTMRIPIIAGRTFERLDRQSEYEMMISRHTAMQFFHDSTGQAAIGKRARGLPSGPYYTIIGVVGDVRDTALAAQPAQAVYFPEVPSKDQNFGQSRSTMALVVRTAGDPAAITSSVQRVVRDLDPTLPTFDVRPMTQVMRASMAQLSFVIIILGAAALVTLVLGAVGLYGVMAYLVTLRTREFGVRMALGAQPSAVAGMMTRQGLVLTAFGVAGGLGLFFGVARFLRSFLFGVAPGDPVTLAAASLMLVAIAALASWIPARRAARVDPADALRAE